MAAQNPSGGTFDLEVQFTGLCLFTTAVGGVEVLLPDARDPDRYVNGRARQALDTMPVDWHVGYVTFDTELVAPGLPGETVVRLDDERLDFQVPAAQGPDPAGLENVADLSYVVGGGTRLHAATARDAGASPYLLARVPLGGGSLSTEWKPTPWCFSRQLNPNQPNFSGPLAHLVTWTVPNLPGDGLTLAFQDLDTGKTNREVRFTATGPAGRRKVSLKIANLCHSNPLEWDEIPHKPEPDHAFQDPDFRWYYRLLDDVEIEPRLEGYLLPIPICRPGVSGVRSNCLPAKFGP